jgi:V8-like Glu-specific endopeptidase
VVASANQSVVLTAAHCLHTRKFGWARRLAFVPSYHEGSTPFGIWAFRDAVVRTKWIKRERFRNDFGAVVLSSLGGATIEATVGAYGLAWNLPRQPTYRVAGYPANYFNGERMTGCYGPVVGVDRVTGATALKCDLGLGSSGAGWIAQDQYVNSVVSYRLRRRPNLSFGPYFRSSAIGLVNHAGNR